MRREPTAKDVDSRLFMLENFVKLLVVENGVDVKDLQGMLTLFRALPYQPIRCGKML